MAVLFGLSDREYRQRPELSQSQFKDFYRNIRLFHKKYILGEKVKEDAEADSEYKTYGSLVDCLWTNEKEFEDRFCFSSVNRPSGQVGDFVDSLYRHTMLNADAEGRLLCGMEDLYPIAHKECGTKSTLEKFLEKFTKEGLTYYEELRSRGDKILISNQDFEKASYLLQKLREHPYCEGLINLETNDRFIVHYQLVMTGEIEGVPIRIMVDKAIEDTQEGKFYPWDLKITSIFSYNYLKMMWYLQEGVYTEICRQNWPQYEVAPLSYLAVDSTMYLDPCKYIGKEENYLQAMHGFRRDGKTYPGVYSLLDDYKYCLEHNCWTSGRHIHQNKGRIELEIFDPLP